MDEAMNCPTAIVLSVLQTVREVSVPDSRVDYQLRRGIFTRSH